MGRINQPRQTGHGGLLLPAGTGKYLIQDGHDNANSCNFKYQINIHIKSK